MLVLVVLINLTWSQILCAKDDEDAESDHDFGGKLLRSMKNDANLDLPVDEEYEDLRAEFLAYHTALASLTSSNRRSMMTTPCWSLGGICVDYKLCTGFRFLTEVPGCKDRLNVCCFAWNRFQVRDMTDKGIKNIAMPWSQHKDFGGLGVLETEPTVKKLKKSKKQKQNKTIAIVLRLNK